MNIENIIELLMSDDEDSRKLGFDLLLKQENAVINKIYQDFTKELGDYLYTELLAVRCMPYLYPNSSKNRKKALSINKLMDYGYPR